MVPNRSESIRNGFYAFFYAILSVWDIFWHQIQPEIAPNDVIWHLKSWIRGSLNLIPCYKSFDKLTTFTSSTASFLEHQNSKNIQKIKNLFKTLRKHHNTLLNPEGHRLDRSVGFWPNIHLPLGEVDSLGAAILPFTLKIQCKSNVNCQLLNIKTVNFSSANGYLYLRSQIDSEHILWDLATL